MFGYWNKSEVINPNFSTKFITNSETLQNSSCEKLFKN